MECNKDEALRAKTIAEKKLEDRDFAGAKKFALKAQNLFPPLEGLSQMMTTLDVYIAAENKVSGEVDWYGVLGVAPSADDETIRKQYRKLALMLHPDKNKSVGADGAFKLLSEAWSLLSDKGKRLAYNQRRSFIGIQPKVSSQTGRSSSAHSANGFHNFPNSIPSKVNTQKNAVPPPSSRRTDTFWTICNKCKMHYEYLKVYLNNTLLCPNCHQAFVAAEMAPPGNMSKSSKSYPPQPHQNRSNQEPSGNPAKNTTYAHNIRQGGSAGPNFSKHTNAHWGAFSNMAGTGNSEPSIAAKAANVVQQVNERFKRAREESQGFGLKSDLPSKRRVLDGDGQYHGEKMSFPMSTGNGGAGTRSISGFQGFSVPHSTRPNGTRELTTLETRKMLMEKARVEIRKKLGEWNSEADRKAAEKRKLEQRKEEKKKNAMNGGAQANVIGESSSTKRADASGKHVASSSADASGKNVGGSSANASEKHVGSSSGDASGKHVGSSSTDAEHKEDTVTLSMNVPDPDFHDFDQDRMEKAFEDNQIWAAYDDDDGMPRFYAFIQKVISRKPFKMKIGWLNSKTNSEFGPMEWVSSGFSKTCGEFRIRKFEMNKSLNSFSHKVKWTKGTRGILHIVPQKGDIWALYRNWSPEWNELTPDEVIHKYDMVEVLDDYSEEQGVAVTPLIKVAGFRTVFHPHPDQSKVVRIPKGEMFRFSHQVPNYTLTGQEAQNAPKGCLELDPAATPLELLQVITAVGEAAATENGGHVKEDTVENALGTKVEETADGVAGSKGGKVVNEKSASKS